MLIRRLASTVAVPVLTIALSAPALAYFDNYLTSTIVGTMNKKESTSFMQTLGKTLNEAPDGQAASWTYPAEGKRQQLDGTLTPLVTRTDAGQKCRRLKTELKRGTAEEHWTGWFCKQPDGQWKSRQVKD